jgi:hypothetical protein
LQEKTLSSTAAAHFQQGGTKRRRLVGGSPNHVDDNELDRSPNLGQVTIFPAL